LLGFRVRCVCYSQYLSDRDHDLFRPVFEAFGVSRFIKYSQITSYSEDSTTAKGDIRLMTQELIKNSPFSVSEDDGNHVVPASSEPGSKKASKKSKKRKHGPSVPAVEDKGHTFFPHLFPHLLQPQRGSVTEPAERSLVSKDCKSTKRKRSFKPAIQGTSRLPCHNTGQEILLVDEVDVFFGDTFYGATYNKVTSMHWNEIEQIIKAIWNSKGQKQWVKDIVAMPEYRALLKKLPNWGFLLETEISLMISQVNKFDDPPYIFDRSTDRVGYKVLDSVSYEVSYGYRTTFAYLNEHSKGNLSNAKETLQRVLQLQVSCGSFSYANINPACILGVSGTLKALGPYQKQVMNRYNIHTFTYVPSVYGDNNFSFDSAGDGVRIEANESNFYHSIVDKINVMSKARRAVIVFFEDSIKLGDFKKSPHYKKIARKSLLTESLTKEEKEFMIKKAATAGTVTLSTAVFGRGTDFVCLDEQLLKNGGVHVIQTFLSTEKSEEVQIQGRTARQGKRGSYELIILQRDLDPFGLNVQHCKTIPKKELYIELDRCRQISYSEKTALIEEKLKNATDRDRITHDYFNALLAHDKPRATSTFQEVYKHAKNGRPSEVSLDLCFVVDCTGSMGAFMSMMSTQIETILDGPDSIVQKVVALFPLNPLLLLKVFIFVQVEERLEGLKIKVRYSLLGYRDYEEGTHQALYPYKVDFPDKGSAAPTKQIIKQVAFHCYSSYKLIACRLCITGSKYEGRGRR